MELFFGILLATGGLDMNAQYQYFILEACETQYPAAERISLEKALSEVYD